MRARPFRVCSPLPLLSSRLPLPVAVVFSRCFCCSVPCFFLSLFLFLLFCFLFFLLFLSVSVFCFFSFFFLFFLYLYPCFPFLSPLLPITVTSFFVVLFFSFYVFTTHPPTVLLTPLPQFFMSLGERGQEANAPTARMKWVRLGCKNMRFSSASLPAPPSGAPDTLPEGVRTNPPRSFPWRRAGSLRRSVGRAARPRPSASSF